jgi:hypothetical protein
VQRHVRIGLLRLGTGTVGLGIDECVGGGQIALAAQLVVALDPLGELFAIAPEKGRAAGAPAGAEPGTGGARSTGAAGRAATALRAERSMNTRTFALVLGIAFLLVGIAGFIPGLTTHHVPATGAAPGDPTAAAPVAVEASYGYLLGLFPVNALHNLFHVVWGIYGIVAYRSLGGARGFAKATAVVYAVLTVMGLIPGLNTVFGLIPLYGHDVWLHALIAIAAAYFGFARAADAEPALAGGTTTTTVERNPSRRV